jgi:alpha-beta hydrolase superfamily lysophospholipase
MLELERVRLSRAGKTPGDVDSAMKIFSQFYDYYLNRKLTPAQIMVQQPEWKGLWYDQPNGQYGRPAAFYQQLQAVNLGEAWAKVSVPVLVMHGTADNVMSDADSRTISDIVNRAHSGQGRYVQIEGADHLLSVQNKLHNAVVPAMLEWMQQVLK